MIKKRQVGAILDQFGRRALEQSQLGEALRDDAHRGFMRLIPMVARTHLVDGRQLRLQHHVVDRTLHRGEFAAHREGAGDIRRIVVVFTTGIEQQQITVAQGLIVVAIVHDAGIGAAPDDGLVGDVGVVRAEFVQHFRHHLVLHAARTGEANGAAVGADCDLRRATQTGLFRPALVQTHIIKHMVERDEFLRAACALAGQRLESIDPAQDAGIEIHMGSHGVEDLRTLLHESRQNFVDILDRKGIVRAIVLNRPLGAGACAIPRLPQGIMLTHEQQIFSLWTARHQNGDRVRLREAAQIVKMTVLPISVFDVAVAVTHRGGGQDRDRILADHAHELSPSACELLAIHSKP